MDKKIRVGVLIIKDKKILLVTSRDATVYWSPGGGIENDESHHDALIRELKEELSLTCVASKFYTNISYYNAFIKKDVECFYYIVETEGDLKPQSEISKYHWFSKEDIEKDPEKIGENLRKQIISKLIQEHYL